MCACHDSHDLCLVFVKVLAGPTLLCGVSYHFLRRFEAGNKSTQIRRLVGILACVINASWG